MSMTVQNFQRIDGSALPVDQLAAQLRLADHYDDVPGQRERLALRLESAIAMVEDRLGRVLLGRDVVLTGDAGQGRRVEAPVGPISRIVSAHVLYGEEETPFPGVTVTGDPDHPTLELPRPLRSFERLRLVVTVGFGGWDAIPAALRQAILLIAEALDAGDEQALGRQAATLMAPFRRHRLGGSI